jgi:CubicO group peptidase (beta-lactamase class C family)
VTLANWELPPFNRWAFSHVRELIPTARIGRGDGPVTAFDRDERDLGGIAFPFRGEGRTVADMIDATFTDGWLVLHDGRIVTEWYVDGMSPETTHLLMSVSKSLTSGLAGVFAGDGRLDPAAPLTDYVDELRGTSFEGCTVQHLLDMRAGTLWSEDYEDPDADSSVYEQVAGWRPRSRADLPPDLYSYMASLSVNARPHGGPFEYRSILTDVLGWALERAGMAPFADLFSREIWSKLGAERDADVTVDAGGCALVDGGICATLRDLARFGQMYLQDGAFGGRQVVPARWTRRPATSDTELIEAFAAVPEAVFHPAAMYHDCWWSLDPGRGIFTGLGIHGQQLLVHRPARVVVAKFSTQPRAYDIEVEQLQIAGSLAICEALANGFT